jgi:hypothetical protein
MPTFLYEIIVMSIIYFLNGGLRKVVVTFFLNEKRNNCSFFRIPCTLWKNLATA